MSARESLSTKLARLLTEESSITLLDCLSDGAFLLDAQRRLIEVTPKLCQHLGYGRDELIGQPATAFISTGHELSATPVAESERTPSGEKHTCTILRKNESTVTAELTSVRLLSGEVIGFVSMHENHGAPDISTSRLAEIVRDSNDAIVAKDLNGIVTDWNYAAERIFGYTATEMIGQSIKTIIPRDRWHEEGHILDQIKRGHRVHSFETIRVTKDKRFIDVSVTISPIKNTLDEIIGASKIARDITTAKNREHEIERMSRLYDALSQINQAIVHTNQKSDLFETVCRVLVERGGFKMAWMGLKNSNSNKLSPIAAYGDCQNYVKHIGAVVDEEPTGNGPSGVAFRTGQPYICQDLFEDAATKPWRHLAKAAGYRASAAFPIREDGAVIGTLNVYVNSPGFFSEREVSLLTEAAGDVSFALDNFLREHERNLAEKRVHQETEFSNAMIESMPGIFCVTDHAKRFIRWNRTLETVSGFRSEEIQGMSAEDLIVFNSEPHPPSSGVDVSDAGCAVEGTIRDRNDNLLPYIFTTRDILYQGSHCCIYMGSDISQLKQAEAALRALNESLEKQVAAQTADLREALKQATAADEIKSAFLATMSHELRTPLNSIIGFTGILQKGMAGAVNSEQIKQLGLIRNSAQHLLELINDILDLSKIEAGQLQIKSESFDLSELVKHAVSILTPMALKKSLSLQVDISPNIGMVTTDKRRLNQIITNLLNNAIKFTPSGTIRLSVFEVRDCQLPLLQRKVSAIRVNIADTGVGIRSEEVPKLFQPFKQLDAGLSRQHEGTGLGLAICQGLAERLKGEITVESEFGVGSTFSVTIPATDPNAL